MERHSHIVLVGRDPIEKGEGIVVVVYYYRREELFNSSGSSLLPPPCLICFHFEIWEESPPSHRMGRSELLLREESILQGGDRGGAFLCF